MGNKETVQLNRVVQPTNPDFITYYDREFFNYYNEKDIFSCEAKLPIPADWFVKWLQRTSAMKNKNANIKITGSLLVIIMGTDDVTFTLDGNVISLDDKRMSKYFSEYIEIPVSEKLTHVCKNTIKDLNELSLYEPRPLQGIKNANNADFFNFILGTASNFLDQVESDNDNASLVSGLIKKVSISSVNPEPKKTDVQIIKLLSSWKVPKLIMKHPYSHINVPQVVHYAIYPKDVDKDIDTYNRLFIEFPKDVILKEHVMKHFQPFEQTWDIFKIKYVKCIDIDIVDEKYSAFIFEIHIECQ